jgi:uncharacterized repeat protein (TIGR01451 family)
VRRHRVASAFVGIALLALAHGASASTPGGNGRLLFTRLVGDRMQLFTVATDGSDERPLAPSSGNAEFGAWSPDGTHVAFWRSPLRCHLQCGVTGELVVVDADGENATVVANDAREPGVDWSPDGRWLAYISDGPGGGDLFVTNVDGSGRRLLVALPGGEGVPSWSPDGRRIAFANQDGPYRQLYIVDADGANLRQLTRSRAINSDPDWSPDGRMLAFVSGEPRANVYVMRPDGTGVRRLTHDDASADPSWSPDGQRIAFVSARAGGFDVYTMAADGRDVKGVVVDLAYEGFPDWQALPQGSADVQVFQRTARSVVRTGSTIAFTVLVRNAGPGDATGVALTEVVSRAAGVAVAPSAGRCSGPPVITCSLGALAAGASVAVRITVRATRPGRLTSTAIAVGARPDHDASNNRAVATVTVSRLRR